MTKVVKYGSRGFLKASNANAEDALIFLSNLKRVDKRRALL